jgi:regulation of enolase protein 1 (concanavalin A-like superfamily)
MNMTELILLDHFDKPNPDSRFRWFCPPQTWRIANSCLTIEPDAMTDYWQKTHYGFAADNGHFLYFEHEGNIELVTTVRFYPRHQYDQAGLMVRYSANSWIKTSIEYEPGGPNRLGAVVTKAGYSDWSTQEYPCSIHEVTLRIQLEKDACTVYYSGDSGPEIKPEKWVQIRLTHFPKSETTAMQCGLYACSPQKEGFRAEFEYIRAISSE